MPHCDACYALAAQMDAWGKEECAQRLDQIVDDILPRALAWIKENKPWIHKVLAVTSTEQFAVRMKIAADVRKAIRLADR